MIRSSRRGFYPHGKSDWIAAVKKVYKRDSKVFAKYLQDNYRHLLIGPLFRLHILITLCYKGTCE
jgi:hypothetical protein